MDITPARAATGGGALAPLLAIAALLGLAPASAQERCLSTDQIRDAVNGGKAVPALSATRTARQSVPGDVVRVRLCWQGAHLSYLITTLRPDGRVAHVTIEAASGKVSGVR